jgi:hypothetical protein
MLPRHPAGTLALDQHPRSARRPGGAAAGTPAKRRPWLRSTVVRGRHGQRRPLPSRPARCGQATTPPADTGHVDSLRPAGAARPTEPLQSPARRGSRGGSAADTKGLSVRTPGCPGRLDTGRLDTGRPLDRLDGHPHGGPDEADRATTGLAGVRTPSRPATTRRAVRPRPVTAPGALDPGRLRGDGTCAAAGPPPPLDSCQHRPA